MSSPAVSASPAADRRVRGYAEIATASLILGTSGALLQLSTMPAGLLLVLRMGLAGIVLAVLFLATGGPAEVRRSGQLRLLIIIGFVVAAEVLCFFLAIRLSNVAVGISLEYMSPVWVALVAPWLLHTARERIDMVGVGVAAVGMALIVLPDLRAAGAHTSLPGVAFGLAAGMMFAAAMMLTKKAGPGLRGSTFTLFHCIGSVILVMPLAIWQAATSHYVLTRTDVLIVLVMGLVFTALCFSMFTDGIRFVRVEHAGILGYLEPVTAPFWALLLVGERPPLTTWLGGALIIAAGITVMAFSAAPQKAAEPEPAP
jgi:drug/metabolite transporter (DMT)-like permease